VILLDTSGLLAALFSDQRQHEACAEVLREAKGPLVLSPFVLAELDYLVSKLAGVDVELALLEEVARGAYLLAEFSADDIRAARDLIAAHRDLGLGLADASIAVLARRYRTVDILTLDERHFGALHGPRGKGFRLLPRDA
jgi:predicted nucleic acid-binding protein